MIAMQAIVDPGDRVVVVTPVWPNVAEIPRILGADVIRFGLVPAPEGWTRDLDAFFATITPGLFMGAADLHALIQVLDGSKAIEEYPPPQN
jgi:aspartate/methionine/tyrosine aminotransferase